METKSEEIIQSKAQKEQEKVNYNRDRKDIFSFH